MPRLAVWALLNCSPAGFLLWLACVCSSFSAMNVATSGRSPVTPWGRVEYVYVQARCVKSAHVNLNLHKCFWYTILYQWSGCQLLGQPLVLADPSCKSSGRFMGLGTASIFSIMLVPPFRARAPEDEDLQGCVVDASLWQPLPASLSQFQAKKKSALCLQESYKCAVVIL